MHITIDIREKELKKLIPSLAAELKIITCDKTRTTQFRGYNYF